MPTYTNAFEVDFETLGSIKSCLETSAPHRSRSESSSICEKKKEIQQIVCGRVYSCMDTYTPNVYGKACEVDCEGLEATRSRLVPAVPHRSGSESNSIREKKNRIEQNVWRTFIHIRPLTHTPTHKACISTCQPMDVRLSGLSNHTLERVHAKTRGLIPTHTTSSKSRRVVAKHTHTHTQTQMEQTQKMQRKNCTHDKLPSL